MTEMFEMEVIKCLDQFYINVACFTPDVYHTDESIHIQS